MADASPKYVKRRTTVDTVTWTAITAPASCRGVSIKNSDSAVAFKIRSDAASASSEDTIPAGSQEVISAAEHGSLRFQLGDVICYVQAASGTGPIIVTGVL